MTARIEIRDGGEVWRVNVEDPRPKKRRRFLGFVGYKADPAPPLWPQSGWWAGAGTACHVTGLESQDEALAALLAAQGITGG